MTHKPSNATHEVFNQSPPFADIDLLGSDVALQEAVVREGGSCTPELRAFGRKTGSAEALELGRQANAHTPELKPFDAKGRRLDVVEFHPAYHKVMAMSMAQGLHCSPWTHLADNTPPVPNAHVMRCAGSYMAAQMEAGHCCPITMTNASIATLRHQPDLAEGWLPNLLSRVYDPAFKPIAKKRSAMLGMGMTEKQGGTDVRANTSTAKPVGAGGPGGEYRLTGHKWFLSAPMCDGFLVLAQAPGGLSCFLMPRFLPDGSVNPLHFQRLKSKLGNRSNASSEVEFTDASAWLIGEEGRGVPMIIEMVTLTRLDCAVSSAGLMRLCLANAVHHASYRTVFKRKLIDQPLMQTVLADMALDVEAATALAFRLARSFDRAEQDPVEEAYRRVMTPVIKYWICKSGPALAYEAMECLGGNGYVEEGLLARAYREMPVNAIWEGSGNVMCLDVLRVLHKDPQAFEHVLEELETGAREVPRLQIGINLIRDMLRDPGQLEADARGFVELLALVGAGAILAEHAPHAVSDAFMATRLIGRWHRTHGTGLKGADRGAILARAALHGS